MWSMLCFRLISLTRKGHSLLDTSHTTHFAETHPSHAHLVPSCHSLLAQRAPLHPPPTPLTGCHMSLFTLPPHLPRVTLHPPPTPLTGCHVSLFTLPPHPSQVAMCHSSPSPYTPHRLPHVTLHQLLHQIGRLVLQQLRYAP